MNIYHVWRTDKVDYDDYDSFVVIAESEIEAKQTHPGGELYQKNWVLGEQFSKPWPSFGSKKIQAKLIGKAAVEYKETTIIVASFNAG